MKGPRVTRSERYGQILALRAMGQTTSQIAERIGVKPSAVRTILNDPDGSKQRERRQRYQGTCVECGGPTDGGSGRGNAPLRCRYCVHSKTRPPDQRRTTYVPLRLLRQDVRLEAAVGWIRTHPGEGLRERVALATCAEEPGDRGGWIAGTIPAELIDESQVVAA